MHWLHYANASPLRARRMTRAQPRPGLTLALVCLPVFIGALDLTVISAVLPAVLSDLKVPVQTRLDDAAWAVSGYLLAYAVSMTFMGRVSDVWGRRQVYLVCLAVFFVGSWLVAASPGWPAQALYGGVRLVAGGRPDASLMALYALIFGRMVQAFGAGALVPVSMALVADLYPPRARALPLGVVGAVDTAGWVLGHLYGGITVQFFPWPYLFWINLPVVALMFAVTAWALRDLRSAQSAGGVDWLGAGLIALALIGLNLGLGAGSLTTGPVGGAAARPPYAFAALFAALICFVAFLRIERRVASPLINLQIFADCSLAAAGGLNLLVGFCLMVGLVSVPLFINVAGASDSGQAALVSGYLLSAFTVPLALAAVPGGWLVGRIGFRGGTVLGVLLAIGGFGLMARWRPEMAGQAVAFVQAWGGVGGPTGESVAGTLRMAFGLLLAGAGLGLTFAPIGATVINSVDESERGMASALVIILRLIGMSVSVSTLTAYGLRRSTVLGRELLADAQPADLGRLFDAALQVATRVTVEMAWIAAAVCAAALVPALWLRRGHTA